MFLKSLDADLMYRPQTGRFRITAGAQAITTYFVQGTTSLGLWRWNSEQEPQMTAPWQSDNQGRKADTNCTN
jgi:hypothetical protein